MRPSTNFRLFGFSGSAVAACHGQTVVEYALIVGVISVGVALLLTGFGQALVISAGSAVEGLLP